ncbi:MAG: helix-hairpin-helix domain-containing protein [Thermodesulfobacteriota bacterium]|nr:helix-hairpin-helix domain-containing protein [Thermodesulfobacteriota bacterium]
MKKDDLTRIKHIGPARLKRLKKNGIATIAQLHQTPVQDLARIKSFGKHNTVRIKKAVAAFYSKQAAAPSKSVKVIKRDGSGNEQKLRKSLKKLTKRLNRAKEKLKPLWKKKYLSLYINFKKRSNKLIGHIKSIEKKYDTLSQKDKEKILEKSDLLNQILIKDGKAPKKKAFKKLTREIKIFSGMLKSYRA